MKEYRKFYYSTFPFSHSRDTLHCCCCCYPDAKWVMDSVSYHNSRTPCHVLGMSLKRRKMELLYNHVKSWNWGHIQYFPSPINIPHCYYSTPSTTQDEDITTSPTRTRANPSLPLSLYLGVISSLLVPEYPFYNPSNYTRRMWYCYYVARKRGRSIRGDWIWHNNTHTVIGLYNCHTTLHRIPPSAPLGRHQQKRSNK